MSIDPWKFPEANNNVGDCRLVPRHLASFQLLAARKGGQGPGNEAHWVHTPQMSCKQNFSLVTGVGAGLWT